MNTRSTLICWQKSRNGKRQITTSQRNITSPIQPQPLPSDHPRRNCYFNEDGHLCAKNLSAFWVPELTVTEVIHGTVYTVTGSYEGTESFVRKLERITSKKFAEKMEDSE